MNGGERSPYDRAICTRRELPHVTRKTRPPSARRSRRAVAALCASACSPAFAQSDAWHHTLAIYLMGAGLDGTVGLGPVTADVDVSFSDLVENLKTGMMAAYAADRGDWGVGVDMIYLNLEGTAEPQPSTELHAEVDQTTVSVEAAYRAFERLELIGGARYNEVESDTAVLQGGVRTAISGRTESWWDPYIGARWTLPFADDKWSFVLRADYGGFGVGSESAWQALARFNWHTTDALDVLFGFRVLDTDYVDGDGNDRFVFDVQSAGPVVGVAWRF
jgi:hypothetical protein